MFAGSSNRGYSFHAHEAYEQLLHYFNLPTHVQSYVDFIQHLLFIFSAAMSEYIKARCGFALSLAILFVLGGRDDIDATEPNIQLAYPRQASFDDG